MKKYKFLFFLLISIFVLLSFILYNCFSKESYLKFNNEFVFSKGDSENTNELEENVDKQLGDINFDSLEEIASSLPNIDSLIFGKSFVSLVKKFIYAEESEKIYNNFLPYIMEVIFSNFANIIPYFTLIISLSVLSSILHQLCSENKNSIQPIIRVICFSSISLIVLKLILQLLNNSTNAINLIERQMEAVFPIILTITASLGGNLTVSTFQSLLAVLASGVTKLFTVVLLPVFIFSVVFSVVGNLSKNVKLDKFSSFFSSFFKWTVGIVFTIFIAFLTLHGLTVSTVDSISLRTAKFALKNYIPLLGSFLSDGITVIMASSVLIKNAVGVSGLFLLFATVFSVVMQILVVSLVLKLTSSILEPICNSDISQFLFSVSKSLTMLITCLIAISFMYVIAIGLLMSCSNIF